jgi:hypothetical protein
MRYRKALRYIAWPARWVVRLPPMVGRETAEFPAALRSKRLATPRSLARRTAVVLRRGAETTNEKCMKLAEWLWRDLG